jgi:alpha-ketoglutaric semialdehyde dehydrogenase
MEIIGQSIIGRNRSAAANGNFHGVNAATGERLEPQYHSATEQDVETAASLAAAAFPVYRSLPAKARARFLRQIADNIEELGDQLIERVMQESALPEGRVRGERGRTCGQLRFFAEIIHEGSWVDARIDTADPDRKPAPKPDLRSMLRPLGPVAVFCASNFPLAFSVAGGDTASALASGCPVIVKAHSSHPGTAELCGAAILKAAQETGMPDGVFSLLFVNQQLAQKLVAHPAVKAGGFTGSRGGGLALLKIAQSRPEPIPFYAEMSSVNPVFILPGALAERGPQIAAGLAASVTLGVGQFCTNPGLVLLPAAGPVKEFASELAQKMQAVAPAAMLNSHILGSYSKAVSARTGDARVHTVFPPTQAPPNTAAPALFETTVETFLKTPELAEEVFGPSSLLLHYGNLEQALTLVRSMEGNLTATIHAGPGDEAAVAELVAALETRVGRILFAGFPTGVEVCQAMVHGGPFPSTSDGRSTSVGARAIDRFVRAVCYQDAPAAFLPEELQNQNPAGILRIVNGVRTREVI